MFFPSRSGGLQLNSDETLIMGVLNVTPDSFSDGGKLFVGGDSSTGAKPDIGKALARAQQMLDEGASIIDVGGESTRPGAAEVSLQQEMDRVLPVVERLASELGCVISVDSSQPGIMSEAVTRGAGLINDVRSLRREGALAAAAQAGVPVCLMHMQGRPDNMQQNPDYSDVVDEVTSFLDQRLAQAFAAGVEKQNILLDPGFGFGKSLQHNLQLLHSLEKIKSLGRPILVGMSRKSMLGQVLDRPVSERLFGGIAATTIAAMKGAAIIRTHDVAPTSDALKIVAAVRANGPIDSPEITLARKV